MWSLELRRMAVGRYSYYAASTTCFRLIHLGHKPAEQFATLNWRSVACLLSTPRHPSQSQTLFTSSAPCRSTPFCLCVSASRQGLELKEEENETIRLYNNDVRMSSVFVTN